MKVKTSTGTNAGVLLRYAVITALMLMIPVLGKWQWSTGDFVVAAALLFGTGLLYELLVKAVGTKHKILIAMIVLSALALVWIELAVGIFK